MSLPGITLAGFAVWLKDHNLDILIIWAFSCVQPHCCWHLHPKVASRDPQIITVQALINCCFVKALQKCSTTHQRSKTSAMSTQPQEQFSYLRSYNPIKWQQLLYPFSSLQTQSSSFQTVRNYNLEKRNLGIYYHLQGIFKAYLT